MTIKKIGVLGACPLGGGSGIAHLAAQEGFDVVLYGIEQRFVDSAIMRIRGIMDRKIEKQRMTVQEKEAILNRISTTINLEDFAAVDIVIETISSDLETKKSAIKVLDKICKKDIIFCVNTSTLSFTALAAVTTRRDKVVGLNFLNPAQVMRQVEVIRGHHTSDETMKTATKLVQDLGKTPVVHLDEVFKIKADKLISDEVAKEYKLGIYYPVGPFEVDYVGAVAY